MKVRQAATAVGRPRTFDPDQALERAMFTFWERGYEGATLAELTKAMRINKPSMYSAFGNKKQLFLKVLEKYSNGPASYANKALKEPTARKVAEAMLNGAAELLTNPANPQGCLIVQGALARGNASSSIQRILAQHRAAGVVKIRKRFEQAKLEGDLPNDSNPAELARFLYSVLLGMAVLASGGAKMSDLQPVIRSTLRIWPSTQRSSSRSTPILTRQAKRLNRNSKGATS